MSLSLIKNAIGLIFAIIILSLPAKNVFANDFAGGSGSQEDPYQIATSTHLFNIRHYFHLGYYFIQTNDIDLSSYTQGEGWLPIGDNNNRFYGNYDGNGYEISNLYINRKDEEYIGLFASISESSVIKNTRLVSVDIKGLNYVGAIVGYNSEGVIENSHADGAVIGTGEHIGGIVGYMARGSFSGSSFDGDVNGQKYVGGLIGESRNLNKIIKSKAAGNINGYGSYIGGLVGRANYIDFIDVDFSGSVNSGDDYVGGLVGHAGGNILNSFASGFVSGKNSVGGLVGEFRGGTETIANSYANVNVTGKEMVGGLVGWADQYDEISECYATGNVLGERHVGGLIGRNRSYTRAKIIDSFATGNVTGNENVGGLVGYSIEGVVIDSFAKGDVVGKNRVGGLIGYDWIYSRRGSVVNSSSEGNVVSENYAGGLIGMNGNTVSQSYATGQVKGNNCVGGLVGLNYGIIQNTYALGSVAGGKNVGGLVGLNTDKFEITTLRGIIEFSYAAGPVSGEENLGGFVGTNEETLIGGYYDSETTGQSDVGKGVPRTTAQMEQRDTFPDWDFNDTWTISDGNSYPYLQWQHEEDILPVSLVLDGSDQTLDIDFNAKIIGTGAKETINIGPGINVSFTAGDGDQVNLPYDVEHYEITSMGNHIWFSDAGTNKVVTIIVTGTSTVGFADGSAAALEMVFTLGEPPQVQLGGAVVGSTPLNHGEVEF